MTTRRVFVSALTLTPLAGMGLLTACGEKAPPATQAPTPAAPPPAAATPAAPPPATATPEPAPAEPPAPAEAPAPAAAPTAVTADDPLAASLGYVPDASQVDATRFPRYAAGQHCKVCALYSGLEGDATGPCSIFNGRLVNAQGWCSVWAKRA